MTKNIPTFRIEDDILKGKKTIYEDGYPSLGQFVLDALGRDLDMVGQIEATTGRSQTQREMIDRSVRCALWMRSQGILEGDNVAICSHNQLDVQNAIFGTVYLGAVFTTWDDGWNAKEFQHKLNLTKPKLVFVSGKTAHAIAEAAREAIPELKIVVLGRVPGFLEFEMVISQLKRKDVENFVCPQIKSLDTVIAIPEFIFLAASMVNRLLKSGALEKYDVSSLRRVIQGGASLAPSSQEAFSKYVPNALLSSAYGATEIGGYCAMQTASSKSGSCGQIVENAQLKVIDPDTRQKLGPNQKGELLLKTGSMMRFYFDNPKATAEAIDEEGWFHSGDLGYYDEDGEIFVLDRLKELIKYRGYQVSPSEIEAVILSHPGVKDATVVGVPHPVDDEHPLAFVVKAVDSTGATAQVTEKDIVDLVAAEMSDIKHLRGGVRFIDGIPKTTTGKILRRKLRDSAKSIGV